MNSKKILSIGILMLALLSAHGNLLAQEPKQLPTLEPPKVLGVLFYADWCNSCKVLEPKLNQVKRGFQGKSILFTRFDFTDEFTIDQSRRYASLLGLENYYRDNDGKTGFMLLIDAQSKKLLGKITRDKSPEQIKTMLTHVLGGEPAGD